MRNTKGAWRPPLPEKEISRACAAASPDCNGPAVVRGLCRRHYKRLMRLGSTEVKRPCLHLPVEKKFWRYVNRGTADKCWEWKAFRDKDGYGKMRVGRSNKGAHIVSWNIHFGEIAKGLFVLHKCNNPSCVNPSHLKLGDHDANMCDRLDSGHYARGEKHPGAKITDEVVCRIRSAQGTYKELAARFGISESQVGNIKRGRQRVISRQAAEKEREMPTLFDLVEVVA